jgi:hypothetical protein
MATHIAFISLKNVYMSDSVKYPCTAQKGAQQAAAGSNRSRFSPMQKYASQQPQQAGAPRSN